MEGMFANWSKFTEAKFLSRKSKQDENNLLQI